MERLGGESWLCKCGQWTYGQKKKCSRCGIKKSWGQTTPNDADSAASTAQWRGGWEQQDWWSGAWSAESGSQQQLQQDSSQTIKQLEQALAALPRDAPNLQTSRKFLEDQLGAAKKAVTQSKPISSQLVSATGAMDRAKAKLHKAEEVAQQASQELLEAQQTVGSLDAEVRRLETETAAKDPSRNTSVETMIQGLSAVIADMKASGNVNVDTIKRAEVQMQALVEDVCTVALSASSSASQQQQQKQDVPMTQGPVGGQRNPLSGSPATKAARAEVAASAADVPLPDDAAPPGLVPPKVAVPVVAAVDGEQK